MLHIDTEKKGGFCLTNHCGNKINGKVLKFDLEKSKLNRHPFPSVRD